MDSFDVDLYKSLIHTEDANENRPYQMLIRSVSKLNVDEVDEIFLLYYLATLSMIYKNGAVLKTITMANKKFSIRDNVRSFIQLIKMMRETFKNNEIVDNEFVIENFSYFSNLKKELGIL